MKRINILVIFLLILVFILMLKLNNCSCEGFGHKDCKHSNDSHCQCDPNDPPDGDACNGCDPGEKGECDRIRAAQQRNKATPIVDWRQDEIRKSELWRCRSLAKEGKTAKFCCGLESSAGRAPPESCKQDDHHDHHPEHKKTVKDKLDRFGSDVHSWMKHHF